MKFYVCNLGCKVNTYESNIMTESLIRNGLTLTEPENADIVIVNTCSVTDVALKKSLKMIRRFKDKIVAVYANLSEKGVRLNEIHKEWVSEISSITTYTTTNNKNLQEVHVTADQQVIVPSESVTTVIYNLK